MRSSLHTEAEAFRWAVLMVRSLGYSMVIFKSDSLVLIRALKGHEHQPTLNPMVQDIIKVLQLFEDAMVEFNHCEGNRVADRIAKETHSFRVLSLECIQ